MAFACTIAKNPCVFDGLRELLANAAPAHCGDVLTGVAAEQCEPAKSTLADVAQDDTRAAEADSSRQPSGTENGGHP